MMNHVRKIFLLLPIICFFAIACKKSNEINTRQPPQPKTPQTHSLSLIDQMETEARDFHKAIVEFSKSSEAVTFEGTPFMGFVRDIVTLNPDDFAKFVSSDSFDSTFLDFIVARKKANEFSKNPTEGLFLAENTNDDKAASDVEACALEKLETSLVTDEEAGIGDNTQTTSSKDSPSSCTKENQSITSKIKNFLTNNDSTGGALLMMTGLFAFVGGTMSATSAKNKLIFRVGGVAQLSMGIAMVYIGSRMLSGNASDETKRIGSGLMIGDGAISIIGGFYLAAKGVKSLQMKNLSETGLKKLETLKGKTKLNISERAALKATGSAKVLAGVAMAILGSYEIYAGAKGLSLVEDDTTKIIKKIIETERKLISLKMQYHDSLSP